MRKLDFCLCKNKGADSFAVTVKLISAFAFATQIVQFLFFLNPKFQASSHLLCLYTLVRVRPGWKPLRPLFSVSRLIFLFLIIPVLLMPQ